MTGAAGGNITWPLAFSAMGTFAIGFLFDGARPARTRRFAFLLAYALDVDASISGVVLIVQEAHHQVRRAMIAAPLTAPPAAAPV